MRQLCIISLKPSKPCVSYIVHGLFPNWQHQDSEDTIPMHVNMRKTRETVFLSLRVTVAHVFFIFYF
jgi:hypothetical protein